jgi:hypothetical protein
MMNHRGNITLSIDDKKAKSNSCESKPIKSPEKIHTKEQVTTMQPTDKPPQDQTRRRCHECDKKIKLTAIQCKCTQYFCDAHRYSDCHDCKFDYKKDGRENLEKNNPVIIQKKLDKV